MSGFEPKIVAFLCNWCSYAGADHAGSQRKIIPANVQVVRVMCSGRMEPQFILKAFKEGADGVMVCGCHFGDCHYMEGNCKAARRMALLERLLGQFGIEPGRFRLEWIAASEGDKFVAVSREVTEKVRALGPLRLNVNAVLDKIYQPREAVS
jgi:F420-non-reducing hydrogenase iron-sulfur subunit